MHKFLILTFLFIFILSVSHSNSYQEGCDEGRTSARCDGKIKPKDYDPNIKIEIETYSKDINLKDSKKFQEWGNKDK